MDVIRMHRSIRDCHSLPLFVSCHQLQELLNVLVSTHATEILFQVLDGLMMGQHVSSSTSDVHHVLTCLLNYFRDLQLKLKFLIDNLIKARSFNLREVEDVPKLSV